MRPTQALLILALLGACASVPGERSDLARGGSLARVAAIFAHRHVSPPTRSALLSARLLDRLLSTLGCRSAPLPALRVAAVGLLSLSDTDVVEFVARAGAECGAPPRSREQALALVSNALAYAYDPHSRYLTPEALLRFQALAHAAFDAGDITRQELVEHLGRRIGIVSVPSFYLRATRSASADLRRACIQLRARGAEVLILDLRGNGGGVQREAARAFGVLAGAEPIALQRRRDHEPEIVSSPAQLEAWVGPIVTRVDAGTASVAELLAAALQDHGRALIIGQRTYGKGTGQTLVPLTSPRDASEGAVDVTDRRFYRIDGRPLQREGVTPDVALPGPERPSERTRSDTLPADQVAPALAKRPFQAPRARDQAQALHAAIDYLEASPVRANESSDTP
jgi:C-terminal processing protease CtpA/Prc